jgi:hypothetical protein
LVREIAGPTKKPLTAQVANQRLQVFWSSWNRAGGSLELAKSFDAMAL